MYGPLLTRLYIYIYILNQSLKKVQLLPSHAQSFWGSRGKRVRAAGLATFCNYLFKKKKKKVQLESKLDFAFVSFP